MRLRTCLLFFCFLSFVSKGAFAQSYQLPKDPTNQYVTPPSPDMRQFTRYGDYPVSRETGVPNISIPLHTITVGDLSVPISLSYHAGGIRVDDIASWVGLGWTLNAGGVITRTIKGIPDESQNGWLNMKAQGIHFFDEDGYFAPDVTKNRMNPEVFEQYQFIIQMHEALFDTEPDVFNYNFNGQSGKFYLDPTGRPITQPKSDIDFRVTIVNNNITEVIAVTPDGTNYIFDVVTQAIGHHALANGNIGWYLREIRSSNYPYNSELITFFYRNVVQVYDMDHIQSAFIKCNWATGYMPIPENPPPYTRMGTYSGLKVLDRIEFPAGKVVFPSVDDRLDSYTTRLKSVEIYSKGESAPCKTFVLNNNQYFNNTGTTLAKRLKLVSLQETGKDGVSIPPYQFTYLETGTYQLPPRKSYEQDYWGYKNANTAQSLIPETEVTVWGSPSIFKVGTANRAPDAERMKAGIINTIKYPTGGITEFNFEANSIPRVKDVPNYQYYDSIAAIYYISGGGNVELHRSKTVFFEVPPNSNIKEATVYWGIASIVPPQYEGDNTAPFAAVELVDLDAGNSVFPYYIVAYGGEKVSGSKRFYPVSGHRYRLHAKTGYTKQIATISVSFKALVGFNTISVVEPAGGLRISSIKNYSSSGVLATQKHFSYTNASYNSDRYPSPSDYLTETVYWTTGGGPDNCEMGRDRVYSVSTNPVYGWSIPQGNTVTYGRVTEREESGGNTMARTVYDYEVNPKDKIQYFYGPGLSSVQDQSWLRGQLLKQSYYDGSDNLIKETSYNYETIELPQKVKGVKIGKTYETDPSRSFGGACVTCAGSCSEVDIIASRRLQINIKLISESITWKRLISKTEKDYGVTTTTTYSYDPYMAHTNVVRVETRDSEDNLIRTEIRYAHELNEQTLKNKNMIGVPLESEMKLINATYPTGILTAGSRLTYKTINGQYIPGTFEEKLTDNSYKLVKEINAINSGGKVENMKGIDGVNTAIKWGYNNEFPVVRAVNALSKDIYYDSFEEAGGVADTNSKTGSKVRTSNYSISISNLTNGKYVLTYWKRTSGIWSLVTTNVTVDNGTYSGSVAATAALPVDEIRFCPTTSYLTTYTADPLLGITSITDPNHNTMYYRYDEMGRLNVVNDNDGKIVQHHTYKYKQ